LTQCLDYNPKGGKSNTKRRRILPGFKQGRKNGWFKVLLTKMDSKSFNSFKLSTMWLLAHMDQKLFKLKNPSNPMI